MAWCGLELDVARNAAVLGKARVVSGEWPRVMVYVVPVDESPSSRGTLWSVW